MSTTKKDNVLSITKTYDMTKPVEVIAMATVLKNHVVQQKLYANIKGKNYAMVEGWQVAGFLTNMNVIVEEPKNLSNDKEIKYSATAKLYSGDKVVGIGYALCSSKEATKKGFDEYAILSMAQTRAIGKAYRNKIGWIMKLAGYEATPSEEMHKVGETPPTPTNEPISQNLVKSASLKGQVEGPDGKYTYICSKCDDPISNQGAELSLKLHGKRLCREHFNEINKKK